MAAGPLVVIAGQTASGKTALGIELARRFNGEIISADSRTVYRGMDIGTAKPTLEERAGVAHYLFDVVDPDERFTAADFQRMANERIDDIAARGKLPLIVGGTGLYIDSVLYDYEFLPPADPEVRIRLQGMSVAELQAEVHERGLPMPRNLQNPRHLMRVLETGGRSARRSPLRPDTLVLGTRIDPELLRERIARRAELMMTSGLLDEARGLYGRYGTAPESLHAPGYRELIEYLDGAIDENEALRKIIASHRALAKRQLTWFKRNKSIHWISKQEEAVDLLTSFLNNYRI